mgnify:CR=1 FL=1
MYNVRERNAGTTTDGMTHDGRTAIASFTVVDNGLGRYVAGKPLITGIGESNTFTNATRLSRSTACQTVWNSRSS